MWQGIYYDEAADALWKFENHQIYQVCAAVGLILRV